MLFVGEFMKVKIPWFWCALALTAAAVAAAEEPTTEPADEKLHYLPPSVFPAVYVYYGTASGPAYDGAAVITARGRALGGWGGLDNIGRLQVWGATFDYFATPWLAAELKLVQESAREAAWVLAFDYVKARYGEGPPFLNPPEPRVVKEKLSYRYTNLDYKLGLRFIPFPQWPVTPYGVGMLGGNSTLVKTYDDATNPFYYKQPPGHLFTRGDVQHFSFDWAMAGGVQVNAGANLFSSRKRSATGLSRTTTSATTVTIPA